MCVFLRCLLPPANEVWGKVIFLHLSVILFTRGVYPSMQWVGWRTPPGQTPPGRTATETGGTRVPHPTGMHSCCN